MFKFTFFSFILFLSIISFGQETASLNNKTIFNQKSEKHIRIPGSRLFITLPKGFTISKMFQGIQMGEESIIQVYDLEGGSFYSNGRSINRENFEAKGFKVYDYSEFNINNYPAKLVHIQTGDYQSYQLVFGDSTFSVMLMGAFQGSNKELGNAIKKAMLSSIYDKTLKIDLFEVAKFTIDESVTRFKFNQYSSNLYMYTPEGKKNEDRFSPTAMVSQLPVSEGSTFETILEEVIKGLKQNTFIQTGIVSSGEKTINGEKGFEQILKGYLNRKKVTVYYLVLRNKDNYLIFSGISYAEDESDLNDFKVFAQTMKLK